MRPDVAWMGGLGKIGRVGKLDNLGRLGSLRMTRQDRQDSQDRQFAQFRQDRQSKIFLVFFLEYSARGRNVRSGINLAAATCRRQPGLRKPSNRLIDDSLDGFREVTAAAAGHGCGCAQ